LRRLEWGSQKSFDYLLQLYSGLRAHMGHLGTPKGMILQADVNSTVVDKGRSTKAG